MIRNENINFKGYTNMSSKEIEPANNEINAEKLKDFNKKALNKIIESAEFQLAQNGKCAPYVFYLDDSYSQNRIRYAIEYDPNEPKDKRIFSVGVSKMYSDKMAQEFLFKGTKKEVLEHLTSIEAQEEIYETILKLTNKIEQIN